MMDKARAWLAVAGVTVAGMAMVAALTSPNAVAQPVPPPPPAPATDTITVAPGVAAAPAAPVGLPQIGAPAAPSSAAVPLVPAAAPLSPSAATLPPVAGAGTPQLGPSPSAALPATEGVAAPPTPARPRLIPATSGTLRDYFGSKNVTLEPQRPEGFTPLNITLPMPRGWSRVPDPNVPDAFLVIADRAGGDGLYTNNAQLVVYKLVGEFDPWEAITHGFVDSQSLPAWRPTDGAMGDLNGMPAAIVEGTYRENDMTLNTSRRHVIAASGPDKYLLTLSVTTPVSQIVAAGNATDAVVRGFRVAPGGPAPAAPPPAVPGAPAAPAPAVPAPAPPAPAPADSTPVAPADPAPAPPAPGGS